MLTSDLYTTRQWLSRTWSIYKTFLVLFNVYILIKVSERRLREVVRRARAWRECKRRLMNLQHLTNLINTSLLQSLTSSLEEPSSTIFTTYLTHKLLCPWGPIASQPSRNFLLPSRTSTTMTTIYFISLLRLPTWTALPKNPPSPISSNLKNFTLSKWKTWDWSYHLL